MVGSTLGVCSVGLIFISARTNKRHHHSGVLAPGLGTPDDYVFYLFLQKQQPAQRYITLYSARLYVMILSSPPSLPRSRLWSGLGVRWPFQSHPMIQGLPVLESLPFNSLSVPGYKNLTTDITLLPDYHKLDLARLHASILVSPVSHLTLDRVGVFWLWQREAASKFGLCRVPTHEDRESEMRCCTHHAYGARGHASTVHTLSSTARRRSRMLATYGFCPRAPNGGWIACASMSHSLGARFLCAG